MKFWLLVVFLGNIQKIVECQVSLLLAEIPCSYQVVSNKEKIVK